VRSKYSALEVQKHGITMKRSAPATCGRRSSKKKQIPETARSAGITAQQVTHDGMLAAQTEETFVQVDEWQRLTLFLAGSHAAAAITGAVMRATRRDGE